MGTVIDRGEYLPAVMQKRDAADASLDARAFSEAISPHLTSMLRLARRLGRQNAEGHRPRVSITP